SMDWLEYKVLYTPKKGPRSEISYSATRDSTVKVQRWQKVNCGTVTHSGRHSGSLEGQKMGMSEDDIRIGGRWVANTGKMQQVYLNSIPVKFALGIAGF
ncbi:hypothetical protein EDD21DRAFT_281836, partial [Dissophora ornata]